MEEWAKLFPAELDTITLSCWEGAVEVTGLGHVAHVSIYDKKTYKGPYADVLVDEAAIEKVRAVIDKLKNDDLAARRALDRPLPETLGLREILWKDMPPADEKPRKQALDWAFERFPLVEKRMKEVFGLRLPRHVAVWAAFNHGLSPIERRGLNDMGRSPLGIMGFFDDLDRQPREGLDARVDWRFRCDPPELVALMGGDSDGLHYGLWYDDPAELPSFIAHNYARDSAETWHDEATAIATLHERVRRHIEEPDYPEEPTQLCVFALQDALKWFLDADARALAEDGPRRWADAVRGEILGGFGPAVAPSHGNPRATYQEYAARSEAYRTGQAQPIIDEARAELLAGQPAYALTVGRELHWLDGDGTRTTALELLCAAYEALGRLALAGIARAHHKHRDLPSVDVY